MKTSLRLGLATMLALGTVGLVGCATEPETQAARSNLERDANSTLQSFLRQDPSLQDVLNRSAGYAVFPDVGKGGVILAGGAFGRGILYNSQGQPLGYAAIRQGNVGPQLGGESYSELVVFQNQDSFNRFRSGNLSLTAGATAIALKAGAAANANFDQGVAVFSMNRSGLMVGADVGGQQFSFEPFGGQ
jgi:lipid-binding SYLF domain-containing protein